MKTVLVVALLLILSHSLCHVTSSANTTSPRSISQTNICCYYTSSDYYYCSTGTCCQISSVCTVNAYKCCSSSQYCNTGLGCYYTTTTASPTYPTYGPSPPDSPSPNYNNGSVNYSLLYILFILLPIKIIFWVCICYCCVKRRRAAQKKEPQEVKIETAPTQQQVLQHSPQPSVQSTPQYIYVHSDSRHPSVAYSQSPFNTGHASVPSVPQYYASNYEVMPSMPPVQLQVASDKYMYPYNPQSSFPQ
jgi:hypothetical protein